MGHFFSKGPPKSPFIFLDFFTGVIFLNMRRVLEAGLLTTSEKKKQLYFNGGF